MAGKEIASKIGIKKLRKGKSGTTNLPIINAASSKKSPITIAQLASTWRRNLIANPSHKAYTQIISTINSNIDTSIIANASQSLVLVEKTIFATSLCRGHRYELFPHEERAFPSTLEQTAELK